MTQKVLFFSQAMGDNKPSVAEQLNAALAEGIDRGMKVTHISTAVFSTAVPHFPGRELSRSEYTLVAVLED